VTGEEAELGERIQEAEAAQVSALSEQLKTIGADLDLLKAAHEAALSAHSEATAARASHSSQARRAKGDLETQEEELETTQRSLRLFRAQLGAAQQPTAGEEEAEARAEEEAEAEAEAEAGAEAVEGEGGGGGKAEEAEGHGDASCVVPGGRRGADTSQEASQEAPQEAPQEASIEVRRLTLRAEEADFEGRRRALDVEELRRYLEAAGEVKRLRADSEAEQAALRDALRRLESLTAERGRVVLGKLSEVDGRLRATFRALCDDGDASLEYATTPAVLFEEGVSIRARPPQSEWSHFEELSGGQKALVAVALQLALHPPDASHPCLYDEVDAALDTRRTKALADFMAQREGAQSIFVSHRPELLEAATMLVGCYVGESGGSQAVSVMA